MAVVLSPKSDHRAKILNLAVEMKFLSEDIAKDLRSSLVNWSDDSALIQYLTSHHMLEQEKTNRLYAKLYSLPYIETLGPVRPEVLSIIPYDKCTEYKLVPYDLKGKVLSIALSDPGHIKENQPGLLANLHKEKKLEVELSLTTPGEYNRYIASYPHEEKPAPHPIPHQSPPPPPIIKVPLPPPHLDEQISLKHTKVDNTLLHKVPLVLAKRFGFVVIAGNGNTFTVAAKDPFDPKFKELIGYLEKANNIHLNIKKAAESEIFAILDTATVAPQVTIDFSLIDTAVIQKVPKSVASEYRFVVYAKAGNQYKVAAQDPENLLAKKIWHYIEQHNHVILSISKVDKITLDKLLTHYDSSPTKTTHPVQASTRSLISESDKHEAIKAPMSDIAKVSAPKKRPAISPTAALHHEGWWKKTLELFGLRKQKILSEYLIHEDGQIALPVPEESIDDISQVPTVHKPKEASVLASVYAPQETKKESSTHVQATDSPKDAHATEISKSQPTPPIHPVSPPPVVPPAASSANTSTPSQKTDEDDLGSLLEKDVTSTEELQGIIKSGYIPKIVAAIVSYAITLRASDVHIEAALTDVRVRYRVDGMLQDIAHLPLEEQAAIVSRIKILSKLKIDETRIPQDGRFDVKFKDREVDLRVSSMPMVHGEKIVMRILDKSHGIMSLEDLGVVGRAFDVIIDAIKKPYGIILSTGPTGSGKSTTLYAILNRISVPTVNVITLEDPVEYEIAGVNQSQIKPKIGYTFAEGLRSVLRQDPNIIMVGEIRDAETASMATHSALTGHLVLSTLHTNDAPGALPRLINMGIEPFLITSSINVVEAQRLVRKTCQNCKEEIELPSAVVEEIKHELDTIPHNNPKDRARVTNPLKFYHGKGCDRCQNGYKGRIGIYEVMPMSDKIEDLAVKKSAAADIQKQAVEEGMITMKQDGLLKALAGLTTIDEVMRETST